MELSLRLSFQLSRSLKGYTMDTTVEFQVKAMEALAPFLNNESRDGTCDTPSDKMS
jgi:hypothetical protein